MDHGANDETSLSRSICKLLLTVQDRPRFLHLLQGGLELFIWHLVCKARLIGIDYHLRLPGYLSRLPFACGNLQMR